MADREIETSKGGIVSKDNPDGAFISEITGEAYSYGAATSVQLISKENYLINQSTYIMEILSKQVQALTVTPCG